MIQHKNRENENHTILHFAFHLLLLNVHLTYKVRTQKFKQVTHTQKKKENQSAKPHNTSFCFTQRSLMFI